MSRATSRCFNAVLHDLFKQGKTAQHKYICRAVFLRKESDLLFNLCCLTNSVTQIVELRAANLRLTEYYNLVNVGRVDREGLLHTYAVGNTSYGEGLGNAAAMSGNNGTLEKLDSFLLALSDTDVNLYTVTDLELRNLSLQLLTYKSLDLFHFMALLKLRTFVQERAEDCSVFLYYTAQWAYAQL